MPPDAPPPAEASPPPRGGKGRAPSRGRRLLALGALLGLGAAGPVDPDPLPGELSWHEPVWVTPFPPAAAPPPARTPPPVTAMLEYPEGWAPGHAAAILLPDSPGADPARDRLIAALIEQGAAVLLLGAPRGVAADPPLATRAPALGEAEHLPAIFGALVALQRDIGAAVVVALGHGGRVAEAAALAAASEPVAAAHLGQAGPRLAAAAGLGGPGRKASFAGGAPQPAREDWNPRALPLCDLLGEAAADLQPQDRAGEAFGDAVRDCRAALLHPPAGPPSPPAR
ncbi:hypothetical protein EAH89_07605 [Roseomonas nepalensis]|uniref:Alpha/beta hydrolase n=1 Tax=Muricoccus nepalensis TaxID=1854500 RepID=A0A502G9Z4_9PROT|nr:hypothetical protein [Roseomonas nepalensis]TPG58471.1 hypothetical protein EAH89_07605 [Roseomonas nepalensis]